MDKIWFIQINNKKEGPFSSIDLKFDSRITPDTLAWKTGFDKWKRIRDIDELKFLFEEEKQEPSTKVVFKPIKGKEELTLDWRLGPPVFVLWLIILLLILIYFLVKSPS